LVPSDEVPAELYELLPLFVDPSVPMVPYVPVVGSAQARLVDVFAAVDVIASTPGTADFGVANEVAGATVTRASTVTESPTAVPAGNVKVTGTGVVTLRTMLVVAPNEMAVGVRSSAAVAGATDVITPRPKAATATSAMRLKVVFVDICFLSISRSREFPPLGFG